MELDLLQVFDVHFRAVRVTLCLFVLDFPLYFWLMSLSRQIYLRCSWIDCLVLVIASLTLGSMIRIIRITVVCSLSQMPFGNELGWRNCRASVLFVRFLSLVALQV